MNLFELVCYIESHNSGKGKTTALAKTANEIDGILLVSTEREAHQLKIEYPNLFITSNSNKIIGSTKPCFIDNHYLLNLVYDMKKEYDDKIDKLKKRNEEHNAKIVKLEGENKELQRQILKMQEKCDSYEQREIIDRMTNLVEK